MPVNAPLPDADASIGDDVVRPVQALYYLASGVWPILSIRTFEAVTGPKREDWLVRTVGALVSVIGLVALRHRGPAVRDLSVGSALALGAVDVVGVASGRLRPVYLLDALAEAGFVAAWLGPGIIRRAPRAPSPGSRAAAR